MTIIRNHFIFKEPAAGEISGDDRSGVGVNTSQSVGKDLRVEGHDENKHEDVPQHCHNKQNELVCGHFGNLGQTKPGDNDVGEEKRG